MSGRMSSLAWRISETRERLYDVDNHNLISEALIVLGEVATQDWEAPG
jgi:hypothetical protein